MPGVRFSANLSFLFKDARFALVGARLPELELEVQLELAAQNVTWAAEQAQVQGASIMIEAVNTFENGPYLLDTTAKAVKYLDAVRAGNVALQYDVYHMRDHLRLHPGPARAQRVCRLGAARVQLLDPDDRGKPRWIKELGYA
jgi:hydroxypyruvate isomerase